MTVYIIQLIISGQGCIVHFI